ncbi:MAG: Dabb family protein [Verrucomicrobiales bacterium]|nr:Dabb family protein [Verrucomicrobiota bacterium JB025]
MDHHVYFWLKEENQNAADRAAFEQGLDALLKSEIPVSGRWSVPAKVAERPVTDLSWDYALTVQFKDVADHDAYQVEPVHQDFLNRFKPWWAKVLVTDLA